MTKKTKDGFGRRGFLKAGAKVLPVLAAIGLAATLTTVSAQADCNGNCSGNCFGTCDDTCAGGCSDTCAGGCGDTCGGGCKGENQ
jgi:CXXX repeat radical SAM target protein